MCSFFHVMGFDGVLRSCVTELHKAQGPSGELMSDVEQGGEGRCSGSVGAQLQILFLRHMHSSRGVKAIVT